MYSEARAKLILMLEKETALIQWDKEYPEPKKPTHRKEVEAALSDHCWLKSAPILAGNRSGWDSEWSKLERSAKVQSLRLPFANHKRRREAFIAALDNRQRQRLIDMLKEK